MIGGMGKGRAQLARSTRFPLRPSLVLTVLVVCLALHIFSRNSGGVKLGHSLPNVLPTC